LTWDCAQGSLSVYPDKQILTTLAATTDLFKLFGDPTRVRLAHLVSAEALTVAEITELTGLSQSRVSTHLGRLREAGVVRVRRSRNATLYALCDAMPADLASVWSCVKTAGDDAVLAEDRRRVSGVIRRRGGTWADSVAGRMERHYSPGRTWEAAARALVGLADLGDVLDVASGDGALAELVAPSARSVTCLDISPKVVEAARRRFGEHGNVRLQVADMHSLPHADECFDQVMLVNSLSYSDNPARVVEEAARVLAKGGRAVAVALARHAHLSQTAAYNHVQPGFEPTALAAMFTRVGLDVALCDVTSVERRAPHFRVITLYARKPS
jgi:ArsR family transcriptional regulator